MSSERSQIGERPARGKTPGRETDYPNRGEAGGVASIR